MFYPKLSDVRDIWITDSSSRTIGLNGVTSVNFNNDSPRRELNILGKQTDSLIWDGPLNYGLSISRNLFGPDLIWSRTGANNLNAIVVFEANRASGRATGYIQMNGGFVTDYSIGVAAGDIPKVQVSFGFDNGKDFFTAFKFGNNYMTAPRQYDFTPQYIPQTGIVLNLGGEDAGQVVTSASFSAKFNWIKEPVVVTDINDATNRGDYFISSLTRPIQYSASVSMLVDNHQANEFAFRNPKTWSLNVTCETGLIATYTIPNAELVSESVNITTEGLMAVDLGYAGVG